MAIKENSSISEKIVNHPAIRQWLYKPLLVLVVEEFSVRAMLVERTGAQTVYVRHFAEVLFDVSGRSMRVIIAKILENKDFVGTQNVLVVSSDVQNYSVWLSPIEGKGIKRMSSEMRRKEMQSEIGPFIEGKPDQYLTAIAYQTPVGDDDDSLLFPGEYRKVPALVFAVPAMVYANVASILKDHRRRLVGMVASESHAFAVNCGGNPNQNTLIINWKNQEAYGALIGCAGIVRLQSDMALPDESRLECIKRLLGEMVDKENPPSEIVIGGEMVEKVEANAFETTRNGIVLKKWRCIEDLPFVKSTHEVPPRYMGAIGAVLNYWFHSRHRAWVNDSVPILLRLKQNVHIVPLVVLLILTGGIGLEYAHLLHKKSGLTRQVEIYQKEQKSLQDKVDALAIIEKRIAASREQIKVYQQNLNIIQKEIPESMTAVQSLINGIAEYTPADVQIIELNQISDESFSLDGKGRSIKSAQTFALELEKLPYIRESKIEKNTEKQKSIGSIMYSHSSKERLYEFRVRLRLQSSEFIDSSDSSRVKL